MKERFPATIFLVSLVVVVSSAIFVKSRNHGSYARTWVISSVIYLCYIYCFCALIEGTKSLFCGKPNLRSSSRTTWPVFTILRYEFYVFSKGISQSALPYRRSVPTWLKLTADDVKEQIFKLGKKGLTPSQIGKSILVFPTKFLNNSCFYTFLVQFTCHLIVV